jgi:hypothetical protein
MALFVISCIDRPGQLALRMATREAHFAYIRGKGDMMRLGGPYLDEKGEMTGSLIVIEAEDLAGAEAFAAGDPYRLAGLFERVEIRPWRITVGALA